MQSEKISHRASLIVRGRLSSDVDIGEPENGRRSMHITEESDEPTGYQGLPKSWEIILMSNGITKEDIRLNPKLAFEVFFFIQKTSSNIMPSDLALIKQKLKIQKRDPMVKYTKLELLGNGSFSSVYHATINETDEQYAIKELMPDKSKKNEVKNEIGIMQKSKHVNILNYFETFKFKDTYHMVMELAKTDMARVLEKMTLTEPQIVYVLRQIVQALGYLHRKYIVHRDIKSDNIMINRFGTVKIGDFGMATQLTTENPTRNAVLGTPCWMAPEVIMKQPYGLSADIWSLGITAIELCDGAPPLLKQAPMKVLWRVATQPAPAQTRAVSPLLKDFIESCLVKIPECRPTIEEISNHEIFKDDELSSWSKQDFAELVNCV